MVVKLTEGEKKILSFLHYRFKINGKFRKEELEKLKKYVKTSEKEINSLIKKFC